MISADLGQQLEAFVTSLVETGRYGSKSEVLREGVRLIQDREAQLAALDAVLYQLTRPLTHRGIPNQSAL
jgi:antitoxin ParD1/3/4